MYVLIGFYEAKLEECPFLRQISARPTGQRASGEEGRRRVRTRSPPFLVASRRRERARRERKRERERSIRSDPSTSTSQSIHPLYSLFDNRNRHELYVSKTCAKHFNTTKVWLLLGRTSLPRDERSTGGQWTAMVSFHQMSQFPKQGQERSPEHPPMLPVRHKPTRQFGSNYVT